MINDAKKALAGLEVMAAIIEVVSARRPDIVEQAAEQVLGMKAGIGDHEFNAILDKRAEAVTHFDKYADRIAELEEALQEVKEMARLNVAGPAAVRICDEVLTHE